MRAWLVSAGVAAAALVAFGLVAVAAQPVPTASPAPSAAVAEPQAVSVAGAAEAATVGPALTFATFNVCKVDCAPPAPSWDVRRDRVARVINESGADVVGVQEATNNPTSFAKTQAEDVIAITAPGGYVAPTYPQSANECRRPRDAAGQLSGPSPCDNTALLLFKASTVQQVQLPGGQPSAGILLASSIAPGMDAESASRSVAWAYLRGTAGVGPFLAISAHTDNLKTPEVEASRVAFANALGPWSDAWNAAHGMAGVPTVLMADLNSYAKRQPAGAQAVLTATGWTDAASAPSRRNIQYSTINYNPLLGLAEQGFPARPYVFQASRNRPTGEATRIDYVMAHGAGVTPVDYEVVMHLAPDGAFAPDYQGSDHQMVKTTLVFP